jgi:DNA helicase HerA-like ATPase
MGVQTIVGAGFQQFLDMLVGVSEYEERERHRGGAPGEIGGSLSNTQGQGARWKADRLTQIDLKQPDTTFNITLRCASPDANVIKNSTAAFNHLSGTFYRVEGEHLGRDDDEFERMLNHELTSPGSIGRLSKAKPRLVVSPEELANFITVPGIHALPKASRGASGGSPAARSPLTSPDETVFETFDKGMSIGQVSTVLDNKGDSGSDHEPSALSDVDDWHREINARQSVHLRARDLREHYIRAATTGSGKTVATINDILTAHANLDGPTFLIDPSGGDMCENYLRSHRTIFDDTDDVEYISIPGANGEVPGLPFFDIRPLIYRSGYSRETAIQNKTDHYFELMRYILGRDTLEQAFVANEILHNLIEALFDAKRNEYPTPDGPSLSTAGKAGGDAFAISDLLSHAANFANNGEIPDVGNTNVKTVLERHFTKNDQQFENTTDAVMNRITKLMERDFIWRMMDYVPEWDEDRGWYARNESVLDLLELLHSNKVVLIDTGDLRQESQRVFTVLFLSHLITGLKSLETPDTDDYVTNVIIEEAAPIARSELMYDELLPEGRKFSLGIGLIMQYPEQVLGEDPQRHQTAYREVLNNVNSKIIGNVATDDLLADALFHEGLDAKEIKDRVSGLPRGEFVVQLPPTGFQEQQPEILTLEPHPIPPGHSESARPIRSKVDEVHRKTINRYCISSASTADRIDPSAVSGRDEAARSHDTDGDEPHTKPPRALTDEERTFLRDVIRAWNGTIDFYRRGDPMGTQEFDRRGVAPELVDHGYLEEHSIANQFTYYWPEDKTLSLFDDLEIEWGPEKADPNESARHKVIVALLERYYKDRGADVRTYVGTNEAKQVTFDLIARRSSSDDSPFHRVVEVETSRQDRPNTPLRKEDVLSDYEKLGDLVGSIDNAKAIWVVENINAAHHLLDILEETGHVSSRPSREVQNYNKLSERVVSGAGLDVINGFQIVIDNVLGLDLYQGLESTDGD